MECDKCPRCDNFTMVDCRCTECGYAVESGSPNADRDRAIEPDADPPGVNRLPLKEILESTPTEVDESASKDRFTTKLSSDHFRVRAGDVWIDPVLFSSATLEPAWNPEDEAAYAAASQPALQKLDPELYVVQDGDVWLKRGVVHSIAELDPIEPAERETITNLSSTPGVNLAEIRTAITKRAGNPNHQLEDESLYTKVARVAARAGALLFDLEKWRKGGADQGGKFWAGATYWAGVHHSFGEILLELDEAAARCNCDLGLSAIDAFITRDKYEKIKSYFGGENSINVYIPDLVKVAYGKNMRFAPAWFVDEGKTLAVVDISVRDYGSFTITSRYTGLKLHSHTFDSWALAVDVANDLYHQIFNDQERQAMTLSDGDQMLKIVRKQIGGWIDQCNAMNMVCEFVTKGQGDDS